MSKKKDTDQTLGVLAVFGIGIPILWLLQQVWFWWTLLASVLLVMLVVFIRGARRQRPSVDIVSTRPAPRPIPPRHNPVRVIPPPVVDFEQAVLASLPTPQDASPTQWRRQHYRPQDAPPHWDVPPARWFTPGEYKPVTDVAPPRARAVGARARDEKGR
jgi:hypothetical protein